MGSVRELRAYYLFPLASVCHVPPHELGKLRLGDFARLIHGIDQQRGQ
jgi:hypothetical protein